MAEQTIQAGVVIKAQVDGKEKIEALSQSIQKSSAQTAQLSEEAKKLKELASAKATLGLDVDDKIRQKIEQVNEAYEKLKESGTLSETELARATEMHKSKVKELTYSIQQMGNQSEQSASGVGKLSGNLLKLGGAYLGLDALKRGWQAVIEATQQYQAVQNRLNYAFDGAEEGAKQLEFVRQEANRLGLEFTSAANGYGQLAAATKELNISQEETQGIFTGVASAVAGMGLSADEAYGVFLALSQIAGKGKVSMEELRGQLGERLTPAMSIAAKSMGVTTAELEKMVENGISAEKFLPKFGAALEEAFAEPAAQNAKTLNGQINQLKNSYHAFLISISEGGVGAATITILSDLGKALASVQTQFNALMHSQTGEVLKASLTQLYALIKQIGETAVAVFQIATKSVDDFTHSFGDGERQISLVQGALSGLSLAMASVGDGVSAVSMAFNLFSGVVKDLLGYAADVAAKLSFGQLSKDLAAMAKNLHNSAKKSYEAAEQQALNFDSKTRKMVQNIMATGNAAGVVYQNATDATKAATTATEAHTKALSEQEAKAAQLEKDYKDAQAAASELGVDMAAATDAVGKATINALQSVQTLADKFDVLKQKGVNASLLISQALSGSLKNAANEQDIAAIKAKYQELGKAGKLAMEDVQSGILAADRRLQELKGNIDPTIAAFKKLGIQTKESMRLAAEEMKQAFERVKQSGQATQAELNKAFANTADAMMQTGDAAQKAWVNSQARAYDYQVSAKAASQSADELAKSTDSVAQASAKSSQAQKDNTAAIERGSQAMREQGESLDALDMAMLAYLRRSRNAKDEISQLHVEMGAAETATGALADKLRVLHRIRLEKAKSQRDLNQSLQTGIDLAQNLARVESIAAAHADKLDQVTLNNLHDAIDKARQKMQALADEAQNTRQAAEKELLSLQGDTEKIAKLEQQQKIQALNEKLKQAKQQGNTQAMNDYTAAINATHQAYQLKREKEQQQKREQEQKAREAAQKERLEQEKREAKTEIKLPQTPKIDVGNLDLSSITDALSEREQSLVEQVKNSIIAELKRSIKNQT